MPTSPPDRALSKPSAADPHGATRVDGWKEIAAYLRRGERTVKRWEADRRLPVHRVPGGGRASVHAYKHELDAWMVSQRLTETDQSDDLLTETIEPPHTAIPPPPPLPPVARNHWLLTVAVIVAAAIILGAGYRVQKARAAHKIQPTNPALDAEKAIARDLYLKGRFEWNERTPDSLNHALDDFTQSIVHDPTDASAYAGLADTYVLLREYSRIPDQEAYTRAIAASRKAVAIDDSLAEAHRSLGFAEIWGNWDFRDGERELRRAIQLNPRDALSHLWFATAFKSPEWYTVTRREFDLAQELDPSSVIVLANKSIWLYESGDRQQGLELAHRVSQAQPDFVAPHRYLAQMYWYQRDYPRYISESRITAKLQHDDVLAETTTAAAAGFRSSGEQGLLDALYASRKKLFAEEKMSGTLIAEVALRLGKKDEAFHLLQDDYDHHRSAFIAIFVVPEFLALRGDPRYDALRKKIDYPAPDPTIDEVASAHPTER